MKIQLPHLRPARPGRDRGNATDSAQRRWTKDRRTRLWLYAGVTVLAAAAYFWMTSARILSEPIEVNYGPASPEFSASLGPLLGAEFSKGNRVELLSNGVQIFPAMLRAIREANLTICLETYIWESGKLSDEFIEALNERARAGVRVHVISDGGGSLKFKDSDQKRLKAAGVEFVIYGREHWYDVKPNINHHTHRKLMVVDGRIGFTGGMCLADKWLGNGDSPDVWRDIGVKLEGPAVAQMQSTFATNWMQTTGRLLVGPDYFPPLHERGSGWAQTYKSGPSEDPENARIAYLLAIASARTSIKIAHAYFVPDDLATDMLLAARRRGVAIEVVVPAINDSRFGRAASRSRWGKLIEAGATFHQFEPAMYHCKVMIVDDVFVTVGSVNFDNRSFAINDEMNINVLDRGAARAFLDEFARDVSHSKPLTLADYRERSTLTQAADWFCGLFRSQL